MQAKAGQAGVLIAHFVASGAAATGLTVTGKVWEISDAGAKTPNDTTGTTLTVTEIGGGLYMAPYTMTADGVPIASFNTAGTADVKSVPASFVHLGALDALAAAVDAVPTVGEIRTELTDELTKVDSLFDGTGVISVKSISAVNPDGDAMVLTSNGNNGSGLNATGNGSGSGIKGTGGASGNGINGTGGATGGAGIRARATAGNSHGIQASGYGSGNGLNVSAQSGTTAAGVYVGGGSGGGDAMYLYGSGGGNGLRAVGVNGGAGISAQGGATGHGISASGGGTSGNGINASAPAGNEIDANIVGNLTGDVSHVVLVDTTTDLTNGGTGGGGATAQQVWEYADRQLTALPPVTGATLDPAYDHAKDDVLTPLAVLDGVADSIKATTDELPASLTQVHSELTTMLMQVGGVGDAVDLVKLDTEAILASGGSGGPTEAEIAAAVWAAPSKVVTGIPAVTGATLSPAYDKAKDDVLTPLATLDAVADAIKAKTDNLPAQPAAVGSAMTLTAAYDHAKDNVLSIVTLLRKLLSNKTVEAANGSSVTVYDDDNTTPVGTMTWNEDSKTRGKLG